MQTYLEAWCRRLAEAAWTYYDERMREPATQVDNQALRGLCQRWKIAELSVFGSASRGTMRPDSDIDLLVSFLPDAKWSLFDHAAMEEQLADLFSRRIDLLTRQQVERSHNWIRRQSILESAVPLDIAG